MLQTIAALMQRCRNYFETGYIDGTFRIDGNVLQEVDGAHFVYVSGSLYHNGVWELCDGYLGGRDTSDLHDEEFTGRVWLLNPPADFLDLCKAVKKYDDQNPASPITSESFGGYSKSMSGKSGAEAYIRALNGYMKMFTEVR